MILFVASPYVFLFHTCRYFHSNVNQIAIMQIPQGMAYALLARLPAIIGRDVNRFLSEIYY